ncbi:MAG: VWA domain-containing protein [Pseudomonadota bacterium]
MTARTLSDFIRALRASGVRVSTGEAIDAAGAMELVGYADRARLKDTLGVALAKSATEKAIHDGLFDLFFKRGGGRQEASLETGEPTAEAPPADTVDEIDLQSLIEAGDEAGVQFALQAAGEAAGVSDIRFSTQVSFFTQKMMKAMGGDRLQQRLVEHLQGHTDADEAEASRLMAARGEMMARARAHVEQQFDVFGAGATEQFRNDFLSEKPLDRLTRNDMDRMRALVEKVAKRLATKHSRRRRRKKHGQLDIRRTLRANAGFDGVPFDVVWKHTHKDQPKILAICDVSGSVSQYVRFLLMLLHAFHDVVPDIQTFAFSGRLEAVDPIFDTHGFETAMDRIVKTIGMSSTDYGQALSDLRMGHWSAIDRRSTLIILGDGRSNYGDGRMDLFREATARAKRTIWLCPEPKGLWGTGDSLLLKYKPFCNVVSEVATLKDLERSIDDVLAAYA